MLLYPIGALFVSLAMALSAAPATSRATEPTPAERAFDRFKALDGGWKGKSTRGWEDVGTWKTIAGGSAVMHTSFEAHPGQIMLTVFHFDGADLMLTHYCVAKNQPRMRATSVSDDGKEITFTFLDSTSLSTRDKGHMDKAVYKFAEDGTYTTQWTWYESGKEQWTELIRCHRSED